VLTAWITLLRVGLQVPAPARVGSVAPIDVFVEVRACVAGRVVNNVVRRAITFSELL
jgi:hypothetical protein